MRRYAKLLYSATALVLTVASIRYFRVDNVVSAAASNFNIFEISVKPFGITSSIEALIGLKFEQFRSMTFRPLKVFMPDTPIYTTLFAI